MELNLISKEQERFSAILTSTISSLCKTGMINSTVARVDGLLGITLANNIVFLVKVQEQLCEIEVCRLRAEEQNSNAGTSSDRIGTGGPRADLNSRRDVLMVSSEREVENRLTADREMSVVSDVQAAIVGSYVPHDNSLQKRMEDRNSIEAEELDLGGSIRAILEDHEHSKILEAIEENGSVHQPRYVENLANFLCDDTGPAADVNVKMEYSSDDELTRDCYSSQDIDTLQSSSIQQFESETRPSITVSAPKVGKSRSTRPVMTFAQVASTSPQVARTNSQERGTTSQVLGTVPQVITNSPQVDHRPSVRNKRTHTPSPKDNSRDPEWLASEKKPKRGPGRLVYKKYDRATLMAACSEVAKGTLSSYKASKKFNLPSSTIFHAMKRLNAKNSVLKLE